jgi:ferredoxin
VLLPAICRTGACSACRTRLLSGEVFIPPGVGLRESDRQAGYIHPCLAYPLTDLRIRLPGPASLL